MWSVNKLEAELAEFPGVFFVILALKQDKTEMVLMLPSSYSLWLSGEGHNVLEIDFCVG